MPYEPGHTRSDHHRDPDGEQDHEGRGLRDRDEGHEELAARVLPELEPRELACRAVKAAPAQHYVTPIRGPLTNEAPRPVDLGDRSLVEVNDHQPFWARLLICDAKRKRGESAIRAPPCRYELP